MQTGYESCGSYMSRGNVYSSRRYERLVQNSCRTLKINLDAIAEVIAAGSSGPRSQAFKRSSIPREPMVDEGVEKRKRVEWVHFLPLSVGTVNIATTR
jgi:hypothetical protein